MKKLILIPIATLTALTPMVSMIGCNKSQEKALASISYTYIKVDPKPYVYQSTQWEQPVTSYEDATNVYYQELTPFMICDEIVNSFYQNIISPFTSDYDSYSVKADCLMIDKEAKRLSIRIYGHYTHQEAGTNTTVTMNYHNLPFDLTYNKVGSDEWPTGWYVKLKGQNIDDLELRETLKNDSTWYCDISEKDFGEKQKKYRITNKTTDPLQISLFLIDSAFISAFMGKIADPEQ